MKGRFWKMKNVPLRVDISNARPRFWLARQVRERLEWSFLFFHPILMTQGHYSDWTPHPIILGSWGLSFLSRCMTRPLVKHYYWLANQSNTIGVCTPMKAVAERAETGFTIDHHSPCGMTVVPQSAKDLFPMPLSMSWLH